MIFHAWGNQKSTKNRPESLLKNDQKITLFFFDV